MSLAQVSVLAVGGTIASSSNAEGASVANHGVQDLVGGLSSGGVEVTARDIFQLGSYLLDHRCLRIICQEVHDELARPDVDGVVVTHGTDTMEETAFLLDLVIDGAKPVVLTGAQRPADAPDADGPTNLRDAIAIAADPAARNTGALISFGGQIHAARATRKAHTVAAAPFKTMGGGPIGHTDAGTVRFTAYPRRPAAMALPTESFDTTRVDVVALHPGADATLAQAAVAAGAVGVILAGTGIGNGNHSILEWAREAIAGGTSIGLSTRVPEGPVVPVYGNGGGFDLVRAGALGFGSLPLFHARLLMALVLSQGKKPQPEHFDPYI